MTHDFQPIDLTTPELLLSSTEFSNDTGEITLDFDTFYQLQVIARAVKTLQNLADSQEPWFFPKPQRAAPGSLWRVHASAQGKAIRDLCRTPTAHLKSPQGDVELNPAVAALLQWWPSFGDLAYLANASLLDEATANHICSALNDCVRTLWSQLNEPQVRDKRLHSTRASRKNLRGGMRWIDNLISHHARLCVLRIDLYTLQAYEYAADSPHAVTLDEAFEHRRLFIQELTKLFQDTLLGYMLKTEFTLKRSIHHHVLIVLDGSERREDITLSDLAGRTWKQITSGRGCFHNVNKNTDRHAETFGVGEVNAHDLQKIRNLKFLVVAYLCKHDYLIRWVVPKCRKLFIKSLAHPLLGVKRGRPRKIPVDRSQPASLETTTLAIEGATA